MNILDYYYAQNMNDYYEDDEYIGTPMMIPEFSDKPIWDWQVKGKTQDEIEVFDVPGYRFDYFDTSISKIKRNYYDGSLTITFKDHVKFFWYMHKKNIIVTVVPQKFETSIWVNEKLVLDSYPWVSSPSMYDSYYELKTDFDSRLINSNIKVETKDMSNVIDITKSFNLNTIAKTDYNVDLINNEEYIISTPICFDNGKLYFENIKIEKLFPDVYDYPTYFSNYLKLTYEDNFENYIPTIEESDGIWISGLNGYKDVKNENNKPIINSKWVQKNNELYILSSDENLYYNNETKQIEQGINPEYSGFNSFLIPWDYENNYGKLTTYINLHGYLDYNIKINLSLGNKFMSTGNQGKYKFINSNDFDEEGDYYEDEINI